MVGTFLSNNGQMIRAVGGGFYDGADTDCCCCCCALLKAAFDATGCITITFTGAITGTGTICAVSVDPGECLRFEGTISMDGDGDCDGDIISIDVTVACILGVGGVAGIRVTISGASATCSVDVDTGLAEAESTCDPLSIIITGTITEIIPTCPCDGGTFQIEITE